MDGADDGQFDRRQGLLGAAGLEEIRRSTPSTASVQALQRHRFAEKLRDVVGLYMDRPDHAVVLSFDETSQIQALDRTQPGLPLKKGRWGTMTHDYNRNGTTTLFAALNLLDGTVIGQCMQKHRHQAFIRVLNQIDASVPKQKRFMSSWIITHPPPHPDVLAWLAKHPRFTFHFIPTSASWLNAVEGLFGVMTKRRLKRGVFESVDELEAAIKRYIAEHNQQSKPFTWTKDPENIIAAVRRGHQTLDSIH